MKGLYDICSIVGGFPGTLVCLIDTTYARAQCEEFVKPIGEMVSWGMWVMCTCVTLGRLDKTYLMFGFCALLGAVMCVPLVASSAFSLFGDRV